MLQAQVNWQSQIEIPAHEIQAQTIMPAQIVAGSPNNMTPSSVNPSVGHNARDHTAKQ